MEITIDQINAYILNLIKTNQCCKHIKKGSPKSRDNKKCNALYDKTQFCNTFT